MTYFKMVPKDNTGDHESLRRENIYLRSKIESLEKEIETWRLHGGKDAKVLAKLAETDVTK